MTTTSTTTTGTHQALSEGLLARGAVRQPGSWWLLPDGSRAHILGGPVVDGEQSYRLRISPPRPARDRRPARRLCRACEVEVATHGDYCPSCR